MASTRVDERARERACGAPVRALLLALAGALVSCGEAYDGPYRHVVLISLDTTRADHLGCYGAPRALTPNIDRLAAEGALFLDASSPVPTTLSGHTSIFTGRTPRSHGVARNGFRVNPDNVTLAEVLDEAGFDTAAFVASFALDSRFGIDQGFGHYDEDFDILFDPKGYDQNQRRADALTDAVLAYVDESEARRRFLFVHYFDAHFPYDPPEPWPERSVAEGGLRRAEGKHLGAQVAAHQERAGGKALGMQPVLTGGLPRAIHQGADGVPLEGDAELEALYYAELAFLDHHLGRLLDGLRQRGILDDALVVLTADHGETMWEHGDFWSHGLCVYDTTQRVPLVVRLPDGRGRALRIAQPVSTIDVFPTLLELLGLPEPAGVEGVGLVPLLDGGELARGPFFAEATQPYGPGLERGQRWSNELKPKSVRMGRWKYVLTPYLQLEELYDLAADPGERVNLLAGEPSPEARVQRELMAAELAAWRHRTRPLSSGFDDFQVREVFERLEALGYVGVGGDGAPASDGDAPPAGSGAPDED